jgi:hypothetical protein
LTTSFSVLVISVNGRRSASLCYGWEFGKIIIFSFPLVKFTQLLAGHELHISAVWEYFFISYRIGRTIDIVNKLFVTVETKTQT